MKRFSSKKIIGDWKIIKTNRPPSNNPDYDIFKTICVINDKVMKTIFPNGRIIMLNYQPTKNGIFLIPKYGNGWNLKINMTDCDNYLIIKSDDGFTDWMEKIT